jgi:large subunit ribosomal protein L10
MFCASCGDVNHRRQTKVNREQKAAFIDDVAGRVSESEAIFAIDYRGVSVSQVAELRGKLGEAGASFQVVKNTLTSLALEKSGAPGGVDLKEFLTGPTAFTYVRGDIAMAAKAIADFKKEYELLEFKGGVMEGQIISIEQFQALTKLPSRDVLNGQLVGMLASPITGVVRGLNGLISGLAIQLGAIAEQGLVGGDSAAVEATEGDSSSSAETPAGEEPPSVDDEASSDDSAEAEEAPAEEDATEGDAE